MFLLLIGPSGLDWSDRSAVTGNALLIAAALCWSVSIIYTCAHRQPVRKGPQAGPRRAPPRRRGGQSQGGLRGYPPIQPGALVFQKTCGREGRHASRLVGFSSNSGVQDLTQKIVNPAKRNSTVKPILVVCRHQQIFLAITDRFERPARNVELAHQNPFQRICTCFGAGLVRCE